MGNPRNQHTSIFERLKDRLKDLYWNIEDSEVRLIHKVVEKPFSTIIPTFDNQEVNDAFLKDNLLWNHEEIIAEVKDVWVEPQFCYAIKGYRKIVTTSRKKGKFGVPSPFSILAARATNSYHHLKEAVLIDGSLGTNYFYFHAAVLPRIYLLLQGYDLKNLPVLVGEKVFNTRYFQQIIRTPFFSEINWEVCKNVTKVEKLIIGVPFYYNKTHFRKTQKIILNAESFSNSAKRIFIDRSNRRLSKFAPIKTLLDKYGFQIVNPSDLSVLQQAETFRNAEHIIGIHGAGMTNLIFCESGKTKVLEIIPSILLHTHYYWLCLTMDIHYDVIVGKAKGGVYDDFEIDPNLLEKKIVQLLSS